VINKIIIQIFFSGIIAFFILISVSMLDAEEQSQTISPNPSSAEGAKIFDHEIEETIPFGNFNHTDNKLSNDQVCGNCIESIDDGSEEDKTTDSEH
jgi:hypothetical protein